MGRGAAAELEPESGADPTLSLVSVSVKGLNLLIGNSEIHEPDEYTAWAQAVVGEQWTARLYAAGALSGSNDKRPSSFYFYVFTDQSGRAVDKPAGGCRQRGEHNAHRHAPRNYADHHNQRTGCGTRYFVPRRCKTQGTSVRRLRCRPASIGSCLHTNEGSQT